MRPNPKAELMKSTESRNKSTCKSKANIKAISYIQNQDTSIWQCLDCRTLWRGVDDDEYGQIVMLGGSPCDRCDSAYFQVRYEAFLDEMACGSKNAEKEHVSGVQGVEICPACSEEECSVECIYELGPEQCISCREQIGASTKINLCHICELEAVGIFAHDGKMPG